MNKRRIIISAVVVAAAFAAGRYTVPTNTTDVSTKHENVDTTTNKRKETTTTETVRPDGTKETVTHTVEDTDRKKVKREETVNTVETERSNSKLSVSALAGVDVRSPTGVIIGAHVTTALIGPVTLGVFGLQNGTVGMSVGLNF